MGSSCCKCCKVDVNPQRVHIKKINEIFLNYLKNQGIDPLTGKGSEILDHNITERAEKYASSSSKDLLQIMQINKSFITKICLQIQKKLLEPSISQELQYLALMLIKELVQTPLKARLSKHAHQKQRRPPSFESEYLFAIVNEREIFFILEQKGLLPRNQKNSYYFTYQCLLILNNLLDIMQRANLFENEEQYLNFINPFLQGTEGTQFEPEIQLQAYLAYFKIIQRMKESNFREKFPVIFDKTWQLIIKSQGQIQIGKGNESELFVEEINLQGVIENKESMTVCQLKPDYQNQLYQLGFDILSYLSMKMSHESDSTEQYLQYLRPIFAYFEHDQWKSTKFAKFTFLVMICNNQSKGESYEPYRMSYSHLISEQHTNYMNEQSLKLVDYHMLDTILDMLMNALLQDIVVDKAYGQADSVIGNIPIGDLNRITVQKKNLLVVFSEVAKLMNIDRNIKQFQSLKFPEAFLQIVNFKSNQQIDPLLLQELERNFKIWVEIYFSKFGSIEALLSNLDYFANAVSDEIIGPSDSASSNFNSLKLTGMINIIEANLYFIQKAIDLQKQGGSYFEGNLLKKNTFKFIRIKEAHQTLIVNLAKMALEENLLDLTEMLLSVDITMNLINEEIIQNSEMRKRFFNPDYLQRYLTSLSEFFKLYAEGNYNLNLTEQLFYIWKLLVFGIDPAITYLPQLFAFLAHLHQTIKNASEVALYQSRLRVLFYFMMCATAKAFSLESLLQTLKSLPLSCEVTADFIKRLPQLTPTELLMEMQEKLDRIVSDERYVQVQQKNCLALKCEKMEPSLEAQFENILLSKKLSVETYKQKLESFKLSDARNNVSMQESLKRQITVQFSNKFYMSKENSEYDSDVDLQDLVNGNVGESRKNTNLLPRLDSLSSEMLASVENDNQKGKGRMTQLNQDYNIDDNLN